MGQISMARWGWMAGFTACIVACGGNNKSQGHASPVPLSEATDTGVSAFCGGYQACCASKGYAFSATLCDSNARPQYSADSLCPAPGAYDPQAAADCFAQVRTAVSACTYDANSTSACDRICSGTLAPGAACTRDSDCAQPADGSATCMLVGPISTARDVCVFHPHGKLGDACCSTCITYKNVADVSCTGMAIPAGSDDFAGYAQCFTRDGLYCSSVDYTCQPLAAIGGDCNSSSDCQTGAFCDYWETSLCTAKLALGSICLYSDACVDGAYCIPGTVCSAKKAAGQSCTNSNECIGICNSASGLCVDSNTRSIDSTAAGCANPTIG